MTILFSKPRRSVGSVVTLGCAALMGAVACGGPETPAVQNPSSYDQQYDAELKEERQEYISNLQEQLRELDNEIARLEARMEGEAQYVSESQRAEWKQELFELRREQEDAQQRLERARTVSDAEWQASRGAIAGQIDRLEAGVEALGARIANVFREPASEGEREPTGGREPNPEMESGQPEGESGSPMEPDTEPAPETEHEH